MSTLLAVKCTGERGEDNNCVAGGECYRTAWVMNGAGGCRRGVVLVACAQKARRAPNALSRTRESPCFWRKKEKNKEEKD